MINPDHLLDAAKLLVATVGRGAPRQADLRRAASTAYYAVFHALAGKLAETFVPATQPKSRALFYRALNHGTARDRCKKLAKAPLDRTERQFFEFDEFEARLREFANTFTALQELRHQCDYDPDYRISQRQARDAVLDAGLAIEMLNTADPEQTNQFLAYLLFGLRPA